MIRRATGRVMICGSFSAGDTLSVRERAALFGSARESELLFSVFDLGDEDGVGGGKGAMWDNAVSARGAGVINDLAGIVVSVTSSLVSETSRVCENVCIACAISSGKGSDRFGEASFNIWRALSSEIRASNCGCDEYRTEEGIELCTVASCGRF